MNIVKYTLAVSMLTSTAWAYPEYGSSYHEDSYHGFSHRSVIYFAPSKDELVNRFLLGTLTNECELDERDVVTLVITSDGYSSPTWVKDTFDYSTLIKMYDVKEGEHAAVLIGKDGREKLRWEGETDWIKVKQTIDSMPLRQAEMKRAVSRCSI